MKIKQKGIERVSVYVPRCSEGIFGVKTLQGKSGKAVKEEYYPLLINIHDCQFRYALRIFCLSQMTIYTLFDLLLNQAGNALKTLVFLNWCTNSDSVLITFFYTVYSYSYWA